jgi:hypothetical protein
MITEKISKLIIPSIAALILAIFLVLILASVIPVILDGRMEPRFKLFGDKDTLKDMKINVKAGVQGEKVPMKTLLHNGKRIKVQYQDADDYSIYFSYLDSFVGKIYFDNINQWADDFIHHVYVNKDNDTIYVLHIGRKSHTKRLLEFKSERTSVIPLNQYFAEKGITVKDEQELEKQKFFDFYK